MGVLPSSTSSRVHVLTLTLRQVCLPRVLTGPFGCGQVTPCLTLPLLASTSSSLTYIDPLVLSSSGHLRINQWSPILADGGGCGPRPRA